MLFLLLWTRTKIWDWWADYVQCVSWNVRDQFTWFPAGPLNAHESGKRSGGERVSQYCQICFYHASDWSCALRCSVFNQSGWLASFVYKKKGNKLVPCSRQWSPIHVTSWYLIDSKHTSKLMLHGDEVALCLHPKLWVTIKEKMRKNQTLMINGELDAVLMPIQKIITDEVMYKRSKTIWVKRAAQRLWLEQSLVMIAVARKFAL